MLTSSCHPVNTYFGLRLSFSILSTGVLRAQSKTVTISYGLGSCRWPFLSDRKASAHLEVLTPTLTHRVWRVPFSSTCHPVISIVATLNLRVSGGIKVNPGGIKKPESFTCHFIFSTQLSSLALHGEWNLFQLLIFHLFRKPLLVITVFNSGSPATQVFQQSVHFKGFVSTSVFWKWRDYGVEIIA